MKRGLIVLGIMTLGSMAGAATDGPPLQRFSYGKVEWMDKVVITRKLEWREEKITTPVVKCVTECRPVNKVVMVPRTFDTTKTVTDIVTTPREVCRDVQRCRLVPVLLYDHATGCCITVMRKEYYTVKVKTCEPETRVVPRQVCVKVTKLVPETRCIHEQVLVKRVENVCEVRRFPVIVGCPTTVRVPVCMPVDCAGAPLPGIPSAVPGLPPGAPPLAPLPPPLVPTFPAPPRY